MPRSRPIVHAALALAAAAALAACGAPAQPTDQDRPQVHAEVRSSTDESVLGASLVFLDGAVINPSAFAEVYDGVWFAGVALADDDGSVTIDLPDGSDVPPSLLAPAADLLDPTWFDFVCTLEVSDPEANLTPVVLLELFGFPGITAITASGAAFSIVTTQPVDLDEDDMIEAARFVTLAYSDAATTIATPPGGCNDGWTDVFVDVDLAEGWNQLAWYLTFERDPITDEVTGIEAVHLVNDDTSPVHVLALPFYLGQEFAESSDLGLGGALGR